MRARSKATNASLPYYNLGRARQRVSTDDPQDVANLNARMPNTCHTNCNSTETRFIYFRSSPESVYGFLMCVTLHH